MPILRFAFFLSLLISINTSADGRGWQGSLQDGSRITIDPNTNKAMRSRDGESTPLWNGVHRLNNGAVIIVRDGVVVRDETVIEAQREQERNHLDAACMQLVTKVCGPHNECDSSPACDPARQLLVMERDELNGSWSGATLESSTLCLEALGNENYFTSCTHRDVRAGRSPCERLAERVCGEEGSCAESQGCDAARQLIGMEQQELFEFPDKLSKTSLQCREMLHQPTEIFAGCQR